MVLMQDGSVWATGYNEYGQLGDSSTVSANRFVKVISGGAKVVAAGAFHSMVLKQDGSVWATGSNQHGQYGDGSRLSSKNFIRLPLFGDGMGDGTIAKPDSYDMLLMALHASCCISYQLILLNDSLVSVCLEDIYFIVAMHSTADVRNTTMASSITVSEGHATTDGVVESTGRDNALFLRCDIVFD